MSEVRTTSSTGGEKGVKPERFGQIPVNALLELARQYGVGAEKYTAHNFRKGYEFSKSFDALMRHAWTWWNGEETDPETGTSHMAAVAWHAFNLMTLLDEHPEFDDRYAGEYKEHKPTLQEVLDAKLDQAMAKAAKRTVEEVMPKNPTGIKNLLSSFAYGFDKVDDLQRFERLAPALQEKAVEAVRLAKEAYPQDDKFVYCTYNDVAWPVEALSSRVGTTCDYRFRVL